MRLYDWLCAYLLFLWQEKWPWMTKTRHDKIVTDYRETLHETSTYYGGRLKAAVDLAQEAQDIARDLSDRLARMDFAMKAAMRGNPEYELLVQRMMSVDISQSMSMMDAYVFRLVIDGRAPYLFGNDDNAAWSYYADTVAGRVRAEIMGSKFVQRGAHLSQPLSKEAKS